MKGKKIAILESRLGRQLAELVAGRGAIPVHAPALAELPDLDPQAIAGLVDSLARKPAKLFIFQTGVGTKALFSAVESLSRGAELKAFLEKAIVAVRGPKPAGVLRGLGVRIDRNAAEPFTTREVLLSVEDVPVKSERIVVQRHGAANLELDRALEARGAEVLEIPVYRWSLPQDTAPLERLVDSLERGEIDAAVFTNAEQARNLFLVSEKKSKARVVKDALNRAVVASIGPVASAALRAAGVQVRVEASPPKLGALLSALDTALSR